MVTGAGRGMGKAIALGLAGARVAVTDMDLDVAEETIAEINALGGEGIAIRCDVSNRAATRETVQKICTTFGLVDLLVNNAGVSRPAMIHKMPEADWDLVIDVHLKGSFNCLQAVLSGMMERKHGKIINITSYCH